MSRKRLLSAQALRALAVYTFFGCDLPCVYRMVSPFSRKSLTILMTAVRYPPGFPRRSTMILEAPALSSFSIARVNSW